MTNLQSNNGKSFFVQTFIAFLSPERFGTIAFESPLAFLLTHSIVEARVWVALA